MEPKASCAFATGFPLKRLLKTKIILRFIALKTFACKNEVVKRLLSFLRRPLYRLLSMKSLLKSPKRAEFYKTVFGKKVFTFHKDSILKLLSFSSPLCRTT